MIKEKLIEKLNSNNRGFSLIELVMAIAIISIVSTALLQMFVTSAEGTRAVTNLDNANVLVQSSLDLFKSDPEPENFFLPILGWDTIPDLDDETATSYTGSKDFTSDWSEWSTSSASAPKFRLETTIEKTITEVEIPNVQDDYIARIDASGTATVSIEINQVGTNYNVASSLGNGSGAVADYSSVIPIEITTDSIVNLTVLNNIDDKLIKVYVKNSDGFEANLNSGNSTIGGGIRITDSVSTEESNFQYSLTSSVTDIDTGEVIIDGISKKYNGID